MAKSNHSTIRVAAVQLDVKLGDKQGNLDRLRNFARQAADQDADLVVFPECAITGYNFGSRADALEHAERSDGPVATAVADLCRDLDIHLVYGYLERDGDQVYNALALFGPKGPLSGYRKIHLPHIGIDRFVDPGNRPFKVIDTPCGRLGLHICYDGAFPESCRTLALDGAELLLLPTNWPVGAEPFAKYCVNTRAWENTVHFLAADRVGEERGARYIGLSRIVDCQGTTLSEADGESEVILYADLDMSASRNKRTVRVDGTHFVDRLADRRPDFYGRLTT
jgi:predicted amidohydrolase